MNYQTEIAEIDLVIATLKALKSNFQKTQKLSDKVFSMNPQNNTIRAIEKANADLDWQCMYLDKERKRTSKAIQESGILVSTEQCEYNPSGFHKYNS